MLYDRSALIDQLRELLTEQRYDSVVIHNYCRSARHFLAFSGVFGAAGDCRGYGKAGPRIQLPSLRPPAVPSASRSSTSAAVGINPSSRNPRTTAARAETVGALATRTQYGSSALPVRSRPVHRAAATTP